MLANVGPDKVGTHLQGQVTVLLVFVGHSEGARRAGRECRGAAAQAWGNGGGGGGDEKVVVMGDI